MDCIHGDIHKQSWENESYVMPLDNFIDLLKSKWGSNDYGNVRTNMINPNNLSTRNYRQRRMVLI